MRSDLDFQCHAAARVQEFHILGVGCTNITKNKYFAHKSLQTLVFRLVSHHTRTEYAGERLGDLHNF